MANQKADRNGSAGNTVRSVETGGIGTNVTSSDNVNLGSIPSDTPIYLTAEQFISMVREMRRDPELERQREEERKRMEARRNVRVRLARIEIEKRESLQSRCTHMKGEPGREEPVIGGQVFSDGIERKICLRCQKIVVEVMAPEYSAAAGLVRNKLMDKAKELGIGADVMEELFSGAGAPANPALMER